MGLDAFGQRHGAEEMAVGALETLAPLVLLLDLLFALALQGDRVLGGAAPTGDRPEDRLMGRAVPGPDHRSLGPLHESGFGVTAMGGLLGPIPTCIRDARALRG